MDTLYMPKEIPVAVEFNQLMINSTHLFNSRMNSKACLHATSEFRQISYDLVITSQLTRTILPSLISSMRDLIVSVKKVDLSIEPKPLRELAQFILDMIFVMVSNALNYFSYENK